MHRDKDIDDLYQFFIAVEQDQVVNIGIIDTIAEYVGRKDSNLRPATRNALTAVLKDIQAGNKVSDAFSRQPAFFPKWIIEMQRVNESTGQAAEIYGNILTTLEHEQDLRRNVGKEVFSVAIVIFALIIGFLGAFFIIMPAISDMFADLKIDPPWITRFFLSISGWMMDYWWLELFLLGALVFGLLYLRVYYPIQFTQGVLRLPLYGEILYTELQLRFAQILAVCISGGIHLEQSMELTGMASDNILMQTTIRRALLETRRLGTNIVDALEKANVYHVLDVSFYRMLTVGMKGNLSYVMNKRAAFYTKELLAKSETFGTKLSSVVIIPGFILLLFIAAASAYPLLTLMTNFSNGGVGM